LRPRRGRRQWNRGRWYWMVRRATDRACGRSKPIIAELNIRADRWQHGNRSCRAWTHHSLSAGRSDFRALPLSAVLAVGFPHRGGVKGLPCFVQVAPSDLAPASPPTAVLPVCAHGIGLAPGCVPFGWSLSASLAPLTMVMAVHLCWACHPV
jgi:hypothetical protein